MYCTHFLRVKLSFSYKKEEEEALALQIDFLWLIFLVNITRKKGFFYTNKVIS